MFFNGKSITLIILSYVFHTTTLDLPLFKLCFIHTILVCCLQSNPRIPQKNTLKSFVHHIDLEKDGRPRNAQKSPTQQQGFSLKRRECSRGIFRKLTFFSLKRDIRTQARTRQTNWAIFYVLSRSPSTWRRKSPVPAGWPGSSLRVACPHELGDLRSAPSVSTWKEVNKGAPSRPFELQRSSQLTRNIKGWRTPV